MAQPSYYILSGLVFTPLTQSLLHEWGDDWYNNSPRKLCQLALHGQLEEAGQQPVVLSQVLADNTTNGYQGFHERLVLEVDGEKARPPAPGRDGSTRGGVLIDERAPSPPSHGCPSAPPTSMVR